jgi:hypothetical protein
LLVVVTVGCGEKGPPVPPEPRGPLPPDTVRIRQIGRDAVAGVVVPEPRGPRDAQRPVRAELVRVSYPPGIEPRPDPNAFRRRGVPTGAVEAEPLVPGDALTLVDRTVDQLEAEGVGYTLRYGVRIRDRRGRSSPLVVTRDLRLLPSAPAPRNLRGEPTADGIRLSWEPPTEEGAFRYNVYRPTDRGPALDDPLNGRPLEETAYLDTTVTVGERYDYLVRVALAEGRPYREGMSSQLITLDAQDRFAPSVPTGLVAVQEGESVRLFWDPNPERDIRGYRLYRKRIGEGADSEWKRLGEDPIERPLYLDTDVRVGQRLEYRITAIDRADPPNESDPSEPQAVDVLAEPEPVGGSAP